MLKTRLLLGTLFTAILVGLLYLDHRLQVSFGFLAVASLFTGLCAYETVRLIEKDFSFRRHLFIVVAALAIVFAEWAKNSAYLAGSWKLPATVPAGEAVFLVAVIGLLFIPVATGEVERVRTTITGIFTLVYVALCMLFLVKLHGFTRLKPSEGLGLLVLTVLTCKMTDTGAYTVGQAIGRHKLAPTISPNKTVEGFIGGWVIGTGAGFGCWFVLQLPGNEWIVVAIAAVSCFAQVGDLVESALKRYAGLKDTGRTLGVFGGALDMADSVLVAAPVAYVSFALLLK